MAANPRQRVLAALVDLGLMILWGALVLAVMAVAAAVGVIPWLGPFGYHLIVLALVVLPVTIAFTVWESGRYEATPGKLRVGLRVRTDPGGDRLSWQRSAVRNLLKFGLPWTLAQSAVLALFTAPAPDAAVGVLFAVGVPVAYAASLFIGRAHTIYDWLLGTTVISVTSGRRFAAVDHDSGSEPTAEEIEMADPRPAAAQPDFEPLAEDNTSANSLPIVEIPATAASTLVGGESPPQP
ncbi:MAG: RDD family protein [Propionicimonas sp.]